MIECVDSSSALFELHEFIAVVEAMCGLLSFRLCCIGSNVTTLKNGIVNRLNVPPPSALPARPQPRSKDALPAWKLPIHLEGLKRKHATFFEETDYKSKDMSK